MWRRLEGLDGPFALFLELLGSTEDLGGLANLVKPAGFWECQP
jgi:hypothetical protein